MKIKPIPDGYHTVTPYLIIQGASDAIDFYKAAFGATEVVRHSGEGRGIIHAEIRVGDSPIMLADEAPAMNAKSPTSFGGSPVSLMLYVEDVDASFARAVEAGAKVLRPVRDEDHGDRMGGVEDPFGYSWWLASRIA
jgi:PhnB protein